MLPTRDEVINGRLDHPLYDLAVGDADCCYLLHTGRRSGRRYETEIWFGAFRLAAGMLDVRIGTNDAISEFGVESQGVVHDEVRKAQSGVADHRLAVPAARRCATTLSQLWDDSSGTSETATEV